MAGPGNQSTLLSTMSQPEMTDLVEKYWSILKEHLPRRAETLYQQSPVIPGEGEFKRFDEYDGGTFASYKGEGDDVSKASHGVGYNVTMQARTMAKEINITYKMRVHNKYDVVGQMIRDMASYCPNRYDLDLTHRFSFASSTSYTDQDGETIDTTVGDGLALASTAHTLAFSSSTYSTRVTGDPAFSQGALEAAMLIGATQTLTNFGEQRTLTFNTIVTGNDPGTVRAVRQLIDSMGDVDGAHEGIINTYRGAGLKHVVLPYLASTAAGAYDSTKRRWWFLVAAGQWEAKVATWVAPELLTPAPGNNGENINTYTWTYSTRCVYGIAILNSKGCIASLPTS